MRLVGKDRYTLDQYSIVVKIAKPKQKLQCMSMSRDKNNRESNRSGYVPYAIRKICASYIHIID